MSELFKANHHKGGLKCARLFAVNSSFFERLSQEVLDIVQTYTPSDVGHQNHRTHWKNPYGTAIQFSLFNTSGRFDDTSSDHAKVIKGKKFHYGDRYPTLDKFIATFPDLYNMRINGMAAKSGLSPHEEHIVWQPEAPGLRHTYFFRARFHLPIVTNDKADMMLDGYHFHFNEGYIYSGTRLGEVQR